MLVKVESLSINTHTPEEFIEELQALCNEHVIHHPNAQFNYKFHVEDDGFQLEEDENE